MSTANERQIGGDHYRRQAIQPWDFIIANGLDFMEGNVVRYVSRWRRKDGVNDLKKAAHYLQKMIEMAEAGSYGPSSQAENTNDRQTS